MPKPRVSGTRAAGAGRRRTGRSAAASSRTFGQQLLPDLLLPAMLATFLCVAAGWWFSVHYAVAFQSPLKLRFQSPLVITRRIDSQGAEAALDQGGRKLTGWQEYTCRKFGQDCRLALAIQRAENTAGKCEIYHYNNDGSLDWGYFQINTVHLQRADVNLRDLLDCKANIDFAWKLYSEHRGFSPWSTYRSGAYRRYLQAR